MFSTPESVVWAQAGAGDNNKRRHVRTMTKHVFISRSLAFCGYRRRRSWRSISPRGQRLPIYMAAVAERLLSGCIHFLLTFGARARTRECGEKANSQERTARNNRSYAFYHGGKGCQFM